MAVVAVVRKGERALLMIVALLLGLFVLTFALGKFIFPH